MPDYRKYLLENGTGVDLHGKDETKAAQRAVKDAISHSSMIGLGALFKIGSFAELEDALMVDVTIATPNPDSVDGEAVLGVLPEGKRRINIIKGGMMWPVEDTEEDAKSHAVVMVNAIIVVLIDVEKVERK
ncbi:MAG: Lin0512 family protein [Candidatus Bathyarchaeota archaeon]